MTSTHVTAVLYNEMKSPWDLWIELFPFVFQRSKSTASSSLCARLLKEHHGFVLLSLGPVLIL